MTEKKELNFKKIGLVILLCFFLFSMPAPEERLLYFSGYKWIVKSGNEKLYPGPNYFSDSSRHVWADEKGLHLRIANSGGRSYCTEIFSEESLGYGSYIFTVETDTSEFPAAAVLGLFLYDDGVDIHHNEIDVEYSAWGIYEKVMLQYVMQPAENAGNMLRFPVPEGKKKITHRFDWFPGSIKFESWKGNADDYSGDAVINSWSFTGEVPVPAREKVHMNFWLYRGDDSELRPVEAVIREFRFIKRAEKNEK